MKISKKLCDKEFAENRYLLAKKNANSANTIIYVRLYCIVITKPLMVIKRGLRWRVMARDGALKGTLIQQHWWGRE